MKKKVGDKISMVTSGWSFDHINKKFDKHILRSVPFYEEFHRISLKLSEFFIGEKTSILDIGCSTGTLLNDFSSKYPKKNYKIEFIGIDPVSSMIKAAKKKNKDKRVKFITKSLLDTNFKNFDFITSVLTIQFIHPSKRQNAYKKIYHSLKKGGAFLVFEKIRAENSKFEDINTGIYFISKKLLKYIPHKKYDLTDLIKDSKRRNLKVFTYIISSKSWKDLGQKEDLINLSKEKILK